MPNKLKRQAKVASKRLEQLRGEVVRHKTEAGFARFKRAVFGDFSMYRRSGHAYPRVPVASYHSAGLISIGGAPGQSGRDEGESKSHVRPVSPAARELRHADRAKTVYRTLGRAAKKGVRTTAKKIAKRLPVIGLGIQGVEAYRAKDK